MSNTIVEIKEEIEEIIIKKTDERSITIEQSTKIPEVLNPEKTESKQQPTKLALEIPEIREPIKDKVIPIESEEGKMLINEIPTKGRVIIKMIVVNGKNSVLPNTKRRLGAFLDKYGRLVTGTHEEEWKDWSKLVGMKIDKDYWRDFFFTLTSAGRELNLDVKMHRLHYAFIRRHFAVANSNSPEDINQLTDFYIMDEAAEAIESDKKFECELEAMNLLSKMSESERAEFSLLFGLKPYNIDPQVLKKRMLEKLKDKPGHFLKLYNSPDKVSNILLGKLVVRGLIQVTSGAYYDGSEIIGANKDKTIAYLKDPVNNDKVIALKQRLEVIVENKI